VKRPEGFDKAEPEQKKRTNNSRAGGARSGSPRPHSSASPKPTKVAASNGSSARRQASAAQPAGRESTRPQKQAAPARERPDKKPRQRLGGREPNPDALAKKRLRHAARDRRRAERAELRRFTRRARNRKLAFAAVGGVIAILIGLIVIAVFSPILALRTVVVDGANRIDPAEIQAAVESQSGTPLALLDFDQITEELSVFPLIRSYVTEIVPPDTLLVHIVEREPIGSIKANGVFQLVDPAGIVIQESAERIAGVPLISAGGADTASPAFAAATEVLLALPPELRSRVDSISASTKDDVSFVLAGVGQRVVWGNAAESASKATLLNSLISLHGASEAGEFDVSAPSNGIFRPGS